MLRGRPVRETLRRDEVHVWIASAADAHPAALDACRAIESDDERERRLKLRLERDRRERLIGSALVRRALSRCADREPGAWVFERKANGRPELAPGQAAPPLRFNLSHASGLVACAVTLERDVGVDVESTERRGDVIGIADRYFAPDEARDLHALPDAGRRRRFFEYWTLKESYIKARGTGLAVALRKLSFLLDDGRIRVALEPELEDDPADWQFALFRPTGEHVVAVGVRRGPGPDLSIRLRNASRLLTGR